jgi:tetratricopeptide (TPR) repeat protein
MRFHQSGNLAGAGTLYRQILRADPRHADALHLIGVIAYQTGNNVKAVEYIRKAITVNPQVSFYHNNLGNALQNLGVSDEAIKSFKEAIRLKDDNAEAYNNLGNSYRDHGRVADAQAQYRMAIKVNPHYGAAHNNLANLLKDEERLEDAIVHYAKAVVLSPDSAEVYYNLGTALKEFNRPEEAVKQYRQAIAINPNFADAYNNLANVLKEQKNLEEATVNYKKALTLNPDFAEAYNNLGDVYRLQGRPDESVEQCRRAIDLKPGDERFHLNLGNTFLDQGNFEEAKGKYEKAIEVKPDFADAHYSRGIVLLTKGEFNEGWKEYEWRFRSKEISQNIGYRYSDIPAWDGSLLHGKTILIVTEQGMGDHIQFLRYTPLIKKMGGRVVFECRRELMRLLEDYEGIDVLWEESSCDIHDINPDVCVQLLSLPQIFRTTLDTIAAEVPYLRVDSSMKMKWRSRFDCDRFNVGLVWSGNPAHKNNHNRSCRLSDFEPLLEIPGTAFYSLQKGGIDKYELNLPAGMQIENIGGDIDDFYDTAAVIENLDLVISVDTSVVHLAGALGKPVWTLLPFVPDWRWLIDRNDTPWYPTMRLFRQPRLRDWVSLMKEVADELKKKVLLKGAQNE